MVMTISQTLPFASHLISLVPAMFSHHEAAIRKLENEQGKRENKMGVLKSVQKDLGQANKG